MRKYLIRLDDACPTMDTIKWQRIEDLLDTYDVRPMVGVIPANEDRKQLIDSTDIGFWSKVSIWKKKGWAIALHGFDHCFISDDGMKGLNPLWERSEFAGVSLEVQKEKIRKGMAVFRNNGIEPKYFFAPAHTYDANTLIALREESNIRIISDTIATKPYRQGDFVFIPQLGGHCAEMKIPGIWTFCLHPSTMKDVDFVATEKFLQAHKDEMLGFEELNLTKLKGKSVIGHLLSWIYFTRRRLKGIK
jgi:predicted deacetylase